MSTPAQQWSSDFAEHDQATQYTYVVPFRGLNTEDPHRSAEPGDCETAHRVWFYRAGFEAALGKQIIGDRPWGDGILRQCMGLKMYRKHNTDGTITRQWLNVVTVEGSGVSTVYRYDEGLDQWIALTPTLAGEGPCDLCQFGNRMVLANGAGLLVWDGATLQALYQAPGGAPVVLGEVVDAAGKLIAGQTYRFGWSMVDTETGDETGVSAYVEHAFVGAAGANAVDLTIPAVAGMAARFDKAQIYRSRAGEPTMRREPGSSYAYTGASVTARAGLIEDSALTLLAQTDVAEPPKGRGMCVYDGRLWMIGMFTDQTEARWSEPDRPNTFLEGSGLRWNFNDGWAITGMAVHRGKGYLFKRHNVALVAPEPSLQYALRDLEPGFGLSHHRAVVVAQGQLVGLGAGRLWSFDGSTFKELAEKAVAELMLATDDNDWENPLYAVYDWHPQRSRILIAQSRDTTSWGGTAEEDGRLAKFGAEGDIIAIGERPPTHTGAKHHPWILSSVRDANDDLDMYEWYEDEDGDPIYQGDGQHLKTLFIDPDPTVEHKMFWRADIIHAIPPAGRDGGYTFKFWYDETQPEETYVQTAVGTNPVKRIHLRGNVGSAFAIQLLWAAVNHRILGIKVHWKPAGDQTARL